jgi:ABC-2 type transport system permease protein
MRISTRLLIRRELWESRSIYIAPLAAAVVFLVGFLISMIHLPQKMRALSVLDPAHQREAIAMPYDMAAGLLMLTVMIVGMFYCLGALQGERRDRSILFWKSLPVSDLTTVLSKASIPLLVLPLLTFAINVATQWIMLLLSTVVLWANGMNAATLWMQLSFLQMSLYLL